MSRAATFQDRMAVLHVGQRIAADLGAKACDPAADLTMADRLALGALSLAVDVEASRRAGVEPCGQWRELLTDALARIEAAQA